MCKNYIYIYFYFNIWPWLFLLRGWGNLNMAHLLVNLYVCGIHHVCVTHHIYIMYTSYIYAVYICS